MRPLSGLDKIPHLKRVQEGKFYWMPAGVQEN